MKSDSRKRLYAVWNAMKARCYNPKNKNYYNYGGRGIKVCAEWLVYERFEQWAISTGYDENAPRGQCTIERNDNYGDYCPENCRWATIQEQGKNRRPSSQTAHKRGRPCIYGNDKLVCDGITLSINEWATILGVSPFTLFTRRRRGWVDEDIIKKRIRTSKCA